SSSGPPRRRAQTSSPFAFRRSRKASVPPALVSSVRPGPGSKSAVPEKEPVTKTSPPPRLPLPPDAANASPRPSSAPGPPTATAEKKAQECQSEDGVQKSHVQRIPQEERTSPGGEPRVSSARLCATVADFKTSALLVAHPGHELRVHGWLERERPLVFVLTDG